MPKWLISLLQLIGIGVKEYSDVKAGKKPADAVAEGTQLAVPVTTQLVKDIADSAKKPTTPTPTK